MTILVKMVGLIKIPRGDVSQSIVEIIIILKPALMDFSGDITLSKRHYPFGSRAEMES